MPQQPKTALIRSVATESVADLIGNISETALDVALESGILKDIPIVGSIIGAMKAGRDIRNNIFLKKIGIFLSELSKNTQEDKEAFISKFDTEEKKNEFGEAVMLLLERADDMNKPVLIARVVSAHIRGHVSYKKSMRLCAIIGRCYTLDLELLKGFKDGVQGDETPIAESLLAAGLLSSGGFDGGTFENDDAGIIFTLNEYGRLLQKYVLTPAA